MEAFSATGLGSTHSTGIASAYISIIHKACLGLCYGFLWCI
jgi:hypothetical protein